MFTDRDKLHKAHKWKGRAVMSKPKFTEGLTREMIKRAQSGDEDAKEILLLANEGLLWSILQKYLGRGYDRDDLYQVASLGFLKSVERFDLQQGVKFTSFAVPTIEGEVKRFIRDFGTTVKIPRTIKELSTTILVRKLQDEPREVIKQELELPDDKDKLLDEAIDYLTHRTGLAFSLDKVMYEKEGEDSITIEETLSGDINGKDWEDKWVASASVQEAINCLTEQEQAVIRKKFNEEKTQKQVGLELGISQMHVSRLERRALVKLRTIITREVNTRLYVPEEDPVLKKIEKPKKPPKPRKSRGDREKAIQLLQETNLTFLAISQATGVPTASVAYLAGKVKKKLVTT